MEGGAVGKEEGEVWEAGVPEGEVAGEVEGEVEEKEVVKGREVRGSNSKFLYYAQKLIQIGYGSEK